jgi:hypothetical protein
MYNAGLHRRADAGVVRQAPQLQHEKCNPYAEEWRGNPAAMAAFSRDVCHNGMIRSTNRGAVGDRAGAASYGWWVVVTALATDIGPSTSRFPSFEDRHL